MRDLERAITSLADLVVVVDQDQVVVECDGTPDRLWGLSRSEVLGQPMPTLSGRLAVIDRNGAAIPPALDPIAAAVTTGNPQRSSVIGIRRGNNTVTWAQVIAIPVADGYGAPRVLSIWTDVTTTVEREAERDRMAAELERRVEARTAELEEVIAGMGATIAELETAVVEAGAFNYSISHDLRTPVRTISTLAETLLAEFGELGSPVARDLIARIRTAAMRIDHLIDSLLRFSSVTHAEPTRSRVDLSAIAHRELQELVGEYPDSVEYVVAEGMSALGDEQLIGIVMHNLIANAWKFSSRVPSPRIEVGMRESDEGADRRLYFVRDNGIGLDPDDADEIFQPFRRLPAAQEFEGTGVGLAIVHRIITRHGGRIWVESAPGKGATFCFTLPAAP